MTYLPYCTAARRRFRLSRLRRPWGPLSSTQTALCGSYQARAADQRRRTHDTISRAAAAPAIADPATPTAPEAPHHLHYWRAMALPGRPV